MTETDYTSGLKTAYTYDNAGNITQKCVESLSGSASPVTITYTYSDSVYGDRLTSYNGESITYDAYGRTSSYRGKNISYSGYNAHNISQFGNASFTYYEDGMRRTKTVGGVTHNYTYDGIYLVKEDWGDNVVVYLYDSSGSPIGMQYRNSSYATDVWDTYYYEKNLQGDVIAIYNASGTKLVSYSYDAWGRIISITDGNGNDVRNNASHIGNINPLRYRGYYYDEDLDLYYLAKRYYDPETCRFVTADDPGYLGADGSPLSYNLFAYCMNNPVNRFDVNGNWSLPNWAKVAIGAVATVAAVAVTVATGGAAAPVLIGVAASTIGGAAVSAINHRVTTGSWEGAGKAALDGAADGFMTGGLCALGGSVVGGAARTIKNAKSGITIGKVGTFEDVAALAKTRHYSGLKEFNFIKKVAGQKAAETVGWWQNKCVVKGVMALKGAIYDCGGALTGAYAKEVALTKGYQYLYNVWLM